MELQALAGAFAAGSFATACMLPVELYSLGRDSLHGVFEWHEIHAILFGRRSDRQLGVGGFAAHLAFGALTAVLFSFLVGSFGLEAMTLPLAVGLGLLMWLLTLAIHERVTAVHPWRSAMGVRPAVASLAGHLAYGAALGYALLLLS